MDGFSNGSVFPPTTEDDIDIPDCPEEKADPPPIVYAVIEDQNDFCVVRSDDERPEASLFLDQTYIPRFQSETKKWA
jgi:hypothetical protein